MAFSPTEHRRAEQIIAQKPAKFDPDSFVDRYEQALLTLVRSKIAGGEPVITKAPERGNVINLMDALKRSIEEERRPAAPSLARAERVRVEHNLATIECSSFAVKSKQL